MADATTVHAWMVAQARRRAAGPTLARQPAWPAAAPSTRLGLSHPRDAPRRAINHLGSPPVHYQFVDCRWELGNPERGRELYLAGHIPGASFLDVDADLSDLSVQGAGRHPLPSAERFAAAASRAGIGGGVFVVAYGSVGGAERLVVAAAPLRPRRLRRAPRRARGVGRRRCAAARRQIEPAEFVPRERTDDTS